MIWQEWSSVLCKQLDRKAGIIWRIGTRRKNQNMLLVCFKLLESANKYHWNKVAFIPLMLPNSVRFPHRWWYRWQLLLAHGEKKGVEGSKRISKRVIKLTQQCSSLRRGTAEQIRSQQLPLTICWLLWSVTGFWVRVLFIFGLFFFGFWKAVICAFCFSFLNFINLKLQVCNFDIQTDLSL